MPHPNTPAVRTPREVLTCYYQAMLDKCADDLAGLYAVDAVHEFPFTTPGFPSCYEGREAVRAGYRAVWGTSPAEVQEIRQTALHKTADPEVIIAEHVVVGTVPAADAAFSVPGLLILRIHRGLIARVRDYMDSSALTGARP